MSDPDDLVRLTDTLAWLVDIPSETGNEGRICTQLAARLLPVHGEPAVRRVGNSLVVGRRSDLPLVILAGHLDTVPGQGQGPARLEEGRLHGLGAADMKGGLAVMLHLLEDPAVRTCGYDVVGVFYEGEEGPPTGNGLEPVLRREPWLTEAAFALVLEPSDGEIQLGCNGSLNARVTFSGKASHSARPWWGENAITKAGRWLAAMHEREPVPVRIDGLEYREVMTVTMAEGGIASNIVPPAFTLNLNYRFSPGRSVEAAIAEAEKACTGADAVEIIDVSPSAPVNADHPLVAELGRVAGAPPAPKQGWTDVARFAAHGIAAVNFGPGETSQAHQQDESVAVSDLLAAFTALRALLTGDQSSTTSS